MAKTTVKKGQSWSAVAKAKNIPEEDLRRANPGVKTLKTGQGINVPNPLGGQGVYGGTNIKGPTFTAGNQNQTFIAPNGQTIRVPANSAVTYLPNNQQGSGTTQFSTAVGNMSGYASNGSVSAGNNNTVPLTKGGNVMPMLAPVNVNPFTPGALQGGQAYVAPMPTRFNPAPQVPLRGQQSTGAPAPYPLNGQQSQYPPLTGGQSRQYPGFQTPTTGTNRPMQRQPYLGASSYMDPRYQQQGQGQPQSALPPRPTAQYTGDPNDPNTAAWRQYWNASAALAAKDPAAYQQAAGIDNSPRVMTREEIRRMKQDQRRRQEMKGEGDNVSSGGGGGGSNPRRNPELRRSIVWSP